MRFWLIAALISAPAFGAVAYQKAMDKKVDRYLTEGVVVGGQAGTAFTLLNVRRDFSKKLKTERIVLDFGDKDGKPLRNRVGFFHVAVEPKLSRLVVDLAQVQRSQVDQKKLKALLAKSPLVKKAEITYDPQDLATNLVIDFKGPIGVEAFEMPSPKQASRLVLDVKALK